MGFIEDLFEGAPTPERANITNPITPEQLGQGYYNAQSGIAQQQAFLNALNAQNGIGNLANVYGQQQGLATQLQGVVNGTGPNPAMAQLANTTGANIANQAALMAGQRGSGANAGLLARQAAMQGGSLQQQAVGQGAALQAQQQIAAMQALQQQQSNMANVANAQTGNYANALGGYNSAAQNQYGNILNASGQFNNAQVGATGNFNNAQQAGYNSNLGFAGALAGAGAAAATGGVKPKYKGGMINYAEGGPVSMAGRFIHGMKNGGAVSGEMLAAKGQMVPGEAAVHGDSLKNDTVPAMLSPGEVVIPRHVMQSKDPAKGAAEFVRAVLAKKGKKNAAQSL